MSGPSLEKHVELPQFRKPFEAGDPQQLIWCVIFCSNTDIPLPNWARDAIAQAFGDWEAEPKKSMEACFNFRGGRHTRFATKYRDFENLKKIIAAVQLEKNLRTPAVFNAAQTRLAAVGINREIDSLRNTFSQQRKRFPEIGPETSARELEEIVEQPAAEF